VKLEQSFEVRAPLERVWETLIDVERVAPCLPGAEITEVSEDGTYHGTFSVRLGPTTAAYRGELRIEEMDEGPHRVVMGASGQDKRGQGSAKASIVSTLRQVDEVTRVDVETDFTITGRLARFGRAGMMQDISNRLLRDFSTCLQSRLADAPTAPSGEEVSRGDAPPEAVAAAAGDDEQMDAEAAAASAGASTAGPAAGPPVSH
jgi:uncharacterized protein